MESDLSRKIVKQHLKIYKSQILNALYKCTEMQWNVIGFVQNIIAFLIRHVKKV